jgi:6-phosphofructokinase 1
MKIGVLTSGGDCPGLNACIRAIVMKALDFKYNIVGIKEGWKGLLNCEFENLNLYKVEEIIHEGGTIIGTSRTNPLKKEENLKKLLKNLKTIKIDVLITIGGDDTLNISNKLCSKGIKIISIPKTMDNDIFCTDYTIGFDSAVTTAVEALQRLKDTAKAHRRIVVFEVMGRWAGWVALYVALAGGADWVLIPEVPYNFEEMINHLKKLKKRGKLYALIVVSEGVNIPEIKDHDKDFNEFGHAILMERKVGEFIAKKIEEKINWEVRHIVIGHIQRGGSPTTFDRILATRFGIKAIELIRDKKFGKMVCLQNNKIRDVELYKVYKLKLVPKKLYEQVKIFFK